MKFQREGSLVRILTGAYKDKLAVVQQDIHRTIKIRVADAKTGTRSGPVDYRVEEVEPIELKIGSSIYTYRRLAACQGPNCAATIAWGSPAGSGKWHPFDPETGTSHYATCPDADKFRKKGGA